MEFSDLIYKRRSVRAFTDKKVNGEQVDRMLEAATRAPNACNMQSWHFYAVTDDAVRAKFTEEAVIKSWASAAPVIFVICTDGNAIISRFGERAKTFILQDTALAMENLVLAAADMGLGSCILGMYDEAKIRAILNVPKEQEIVAVVPVGEPAGDTPLRERKPMEEVVTYVGRAEKSAASSESGRYILRDTCMKEALFENINMTGVRFDNIKMADGSFNNINMSSVRFTDINMSGASFGGLCMNRTSFGCVDMREAKFCNSDLSGTSFTECNFSDVTLSDCNIEGMTVDGIDVKAALEFYRKNK